MATCGICCLLGVGWGGGVVTPEILGESANGFFENLILNQTKWFYVYHL